MSSFRLLGLEYPSLEVLCIGREGNSEGGEEGVVKFKVCLASFPPRNYVELGCVRGGLRSLLAGRSNLHRVLLPPLEGLTLLGVLLSVFEEINSSIFFPHDYERVGARWVGLRGWVLLS